MIRKISYGLNEDSFLHITQITIFTFSLELLLSTILFAVGLGIMRPFFIVSFAFSIFITSLCDKKKITLIEIMISILIFVLFSWIAGQIFDCSYDGNTYHKVAVGLLKNHWNPLTSLPNLSLTEGVEVKSIGYKLWVETYCKVTWIFAASIYAMTGNIETGKCYTMISMICAFFLMFYYMRKKKYSIYQCVLISSLVMINPIAIQQFFSYYIDGFLHTIIFMLVLSLIMFSDRETFNTFESASLVAGIMIVCGNIKFTGVLYGGLYCIAFYLFDCYKRFKKQKFLSDATIKETIYYFFIVIATVVWGGATSYVTNFLRHGSLTYPLTGEGKVDIMTTNSPFGEENHFKNLFISLFTKVGNFTVASGKGAVLKIPFTFDSIEVEMIKSTDARLSGFGVIFGGVFIIAVLILICWGIFKKNDIEKCIVSIVLLVSIGLMFGIKESWWARYSPYIYLIVLVAAFVLQNSKKRLVKSAAVIYVLLILLNNCIPLVHTSNKISDSVAMYAYYRELKKEGKIEICNSKFPGVYYNFKDYDIDYSINYDLVDMDDVNYSNHYDTKWIKKE